MKKILKKIFIVILILFVAIVAFSIIRFSYNMYWYNKLITAKEDLIASKNYTQRIYQAGYSYEKGRTYSENGIKVYGDKSVNLIYDYQESKEYGVDLPVVSKLYYTDNEMISIDLINNEFFSSEYSYQYPEPLINYPIYPLTMELEYVTSLKEKVKKYADIFIRMAYDCKFRFISEDGKDYIVLEPYKNDDCKYYFDRETMLVEKIMMLDMFENELVVNEYFIFEKGNVTLKDVEIPDLSSYTQQVIIREN